MTWVGPTTFRLPTGEIHHCGDRCDAQFVNRDCTITCRTTGRCFAQAVAEHPFERTAKRDVTRAERPGPRPARQRARNPFRPGNNGAYYQEACRVVRTLLYSAVRAELNERRRRAAAGRVSRRVSRAKRAGGSPPELRESYRAVPLEAEVPGTVEAYARKVMALWEAMGALPHCVKNRSHIRFSHHILGALYTAQYGLRVGDTQVMERDEYLYRMLPPVHDLKDYGFAKRFITVGKNHIKKALGGASPRTLRGLELRLRGVQEAPGGV
jgi:hypothetical protein